MATTEEIRRKLQEQATQRVNPLLKGLSMLTGGIAGEFTGTNEQIRQQRQARRAIMEEDLAALQQERMMEKMDAFEAKRLKRQLEFDEAQRLAEMQRRSEEAAGAEDVLSGSTFVGPVSQSRELGRMNARIQRLATGEKEAAEKAGLIGRLVAEMGPTERAAVESGIVPRYEDMDIGTLRKMASASEASRSIAKEARLAKREEGQVFISRNAEGQVSVQGPADKVAEYQKANPDLFSKQKGAPYRIRLQPGMEGNQLFADFGDMTTEEIERIQPNILRLQKMYGGSNAMDSGDQATKGITTPTPLPKGPAAEKGAAQVGRGTGETRGRAAAAIASEMAAAPTPEMYGPPSPGEQFIQTGRRLGALEGRGGAATYGAQQTLTSPFYEAVARELGTQPQRVGGESIIVKGAKAVIASEFPTEQWNKLPQEVQNRIYIEALNRSAAEMAKPPQQKGIFGVGYGESPFAQYSIKRD